MTHFCFQALKSKTAVPLSLYFEEFDQNSVQCRNPLHAVMCKPSWLIKQKKRRGSHCGRQNPLLINVFGHEIQNERVSVSKAQAKLCGPLQRPGFPSFISFSFKSTLFLLCKVLMALRQQWGDGGVRTVPNRNNGYSDERGFSLFVQMQNCVFDIFSFSKTQKESFRQGCVTSSGTKLCALLIFLKF